METVQGCKYNWTAFVTKTMVQDCQSKRGRAGEKFLSSVYLSYIVKKQLNIPMNKKELFGARTPTVQPIPEPIPRPIVQPAPVVSPLAVEVRPIAEASTSTLVSTAQHNTREQLLTMVTELHATVLGLESMEEMKNKYAQVWDECAKAQQERQKLDMVATKALKDLCAQEKELQES